jgi:hypothetical protein
MQAARVVVHELMFNNKKSKAATIMIYRVKTRRRQTEVWVQAKGVLETFTAFIATLYPSCGNIILGRSTAKKMSGLTERITQYRKSHMPASRVGPGAKAVEDRVLAPPFLAKILFSESSITE